MNSTPVLPTIEVPLAGDLVAQLRPVLPGDAPLIEQGLADLSEQSRFARFGIGIDRLTNQELRYLTDVDLVNHVAWGAMIDGDGAGVSRYVVLEDGVSAEVAVAVVDRFQRQGLGKTLFRALIAVARTDGIETFRFEVEPSNEVVKRLVIGNNEIGASGLMAGSLEIADLVEDQRESAYVELIAQYRGEPR